MSTPSVMSQDLSQLPALKPPDGVIPNLIDPYTRGPMILALSAVAIGFMYFFVAVRFYSKFYIKHTWTWDDVTCTLAALSATGLYIGLIFLERAGMGTHQWNVRASKVANDSYLKPLYVVVNTLPLIALFVKLTFYILFLQVFRPKPALRWNIYISTAITTVFYVVLTIILFNFTTPRPGQTFLENFERFLNKKRSPVVDATLALGYFNIFSDVYILILPISAVLDLNLPTRRKIGLSLIFMAGILAVCCSTVSLIYRYRTNNSGDTTWNLMPVAYLTILEHAIGIICSCVPACSVALRRHLPLLTSLKSNLTSQLRILGARLTPSKRSRSRQFFSLGESKSSSDKQRSKLDSGSSDEVVLGTLPKIPKGVHQMRTARNIFWGSRKHTDTMDEEKNDSQISHNSEEAEQV